MFDMPAEYEISELEYYGLALAFFQEQTTALLNLVMSQLKKRLRLLPPQKSSVNGRVVLLQPLVMYWISQYLWCGLLIWYP